MRISTWNINSVRLRLEQVLNFVKDKYTAKELGLDSSLPDLVIPHKNILVASNYGSPQGRKRAIAGDYIVPEVTHLGKEIHINMILDNLGPPINNKNKKKYYSHY